MSATGKRGSTRRRFVNRLLGSGAGALLVSVLYPVVRYLIPPATAQSRANSVTLPFGPQELSPNSG